MLLFCACVSMMIRETVTYCKSVFSNSLSFIYLFFINLIQHYVVSIVVLFEVMTKSDMLTA